MTTIPAHVDRYWYSDAQLAAEYQTGDRVFHIDSDRKSHIDKNLSKSLDQDQSGVVIAVARRKELHWREQRTLRQTGRCSSWVGQQLVLVRWNNGTEGGTSPATVTTMLRWQPACIFQKVQA